MTNIQAGLRMKALLSASKCSTIASTAWPPTWLAASIHREAGVLHQLAVARVIAADPFRKLRRRGDVGLAGSGRGELLREVRLCEDRSRLFAQPLDDLGRRAER